MAPEYAFLTRWRLRANAQEVFDVLADPFGLARWWPSVYLDVKELAPPDPTTGAGRVVGLGYERMASLHLAVELHRHHLDAPTGFRLVAHGDFEGTGVWTIRQDGDWVEATYDWRIAANKPLLRYGSFAFRPIFAANHRWAMERGAESLELELRRRRARTSEERDAVPAPPAPTFYR